MTHILCLQAGGVGGGGAVGGLFFFFHLKPFIGPRSEAVQCFLVLIFPRRSTSASFFFSLAVILIQPHPTVIPHRFETGPYEWRGHTHTPSSRFFCEAPQTAALRTSSAAAFFSPTPTALKKLNINYCNFGADYIRESRPPCKVQPGTRLDLLRKSLKTQEWHFSNFNGITSLIFEALEEERVFGL